MSELTTTAPEGQIYVCAACGKTSPTKSGWDDTWRVKVADRGWDESCMLNSILCFKEKAADGLYEPVDSEEGLSEVQ